MRQGSVFKGNGCSLVLGASPKETALRTSNSTVEYSEFPHGSVTWRERVANRGQIQHPSCSEPVRDPNCRILPAMCN